ncbi:unnamed protein product [Sphagnum jensenii]|uniref:Uncharacterized protein n=1 Tax=Sphagnum jensenii TaxID=128206 RepID=A0ABP1BE94_9BRYO
MNIAKPSKVSGHHETLKQCPENAREETDGRSDRQELKTFPQYFQIPPFDSSALKLEDNKETQRMQMKETVEKYIVMSLDYMDPAPSRKRNHKRKGQLRGRGNKTRRSSRITDGKRKMMMFSQDDDHQCRRLLASPLFSYYPLTIKSLCLSAYTLDIHGQAVVAATCSLRRAEEALTSLNSGIVPGIAWHERNPYREEKAQRQHAAQQEHTASANTQDTQKGSAAREKGRQRERDDTPGHPVIQPPDSPVEVTLFPPPTPAGGDQENRWAAGRDLEAETGRTGGRAGSVPSPPI